MGEDRSQLYKVIAEAATGIAPDDRAIALAASYVLRYEVLPCADAELKALLAPADGVLRAAYERRAPDRP